MIFSSGKLGDIRKVFSKELSGFYEEREIINFFNILTEAFLGFNKPEIVLFAANMVSEPVCNKYEKALVELKRYKPIQYILGKTHFYGLELDVTSGVLIPRPETEELVDWIIKDFADVRSLLSVLDIGTGSGCIAIALKKHLHHCDVTGVDIAEPAIRISIKNAGKNEMKVLFCFFDILDKENWSKLGMFDIIVSNPPYVCQSGKALMQRNVLDYEPEDALFIDDKDPLIFYETITDFGMSHLKNGGCMYFEINEARDHLMEQLMTKKKFTNIELRRDIHGKNRMIKGICKM